MPKPKPSEETREEWMERCIPAVLADGAAADQDQAVAMCSEMWRQAVKRLPVGQVVKASGDKEMLRAHAVLQVKAATDDDDQRIITGIATTPEPDRVGDIIEPLGVSFSNPLPLLHQHRTSEPVGTVKLNKPTKSGITFEAKLPKIKEPGLLKDRIDMAWQEVKAGLVRGVSVGFRAIEYSLMDSGGLRFLETEVIELSLVTIPANVDATIQHIKSIDAATLAATGDKSAGSADNPPGDSGRRKRKAVSLEGKHMPQKTTIAEQIAANEASRAAKAARMLEIMEAASDRNETLNEQEQQEYDDLEADVKSVEDHLKRLRTLETLNVQAAKPVVASDTKSAGDSRDTRQPVHVSIKSNVPPATAFARYIWAKGNSHIYNQGVSPADIAKAQNWHDTPEVERILRAPVAVGTTLQSGWAAPLVELQNLASEFAELLRPATIIGRIPGLRRVPFNVKIPRETTGASVNWVGEGQVKPVSAMAFDSITMLFTKVAGIVPITQELFRFSSPSVDEIIRNSLRDAVAYLIDRDFLDPDKTAVTGVSPASITNGVTPITPSGTTADALRNDLGLLLTEYAQANMGLSGLVLVMLASQAIRISLMRNTLGQRDFEGLGPNGGTLEGIPVITSENMVYAGASPNTGGLIVAINANEILLADDGAVEIDVSREASLQMNTDPDSPPTASTVTVSLWQHNMIALKAERFINWSKRRAEAVQFIEGAKYA